MYAPADPGTDVDAAQGFGRYDPWPEEAARRRRPVSGAARAVALGVAALVGALAILAAIQLFVMWFGPCFRGAC